jgi:hypothetical protein
MYVLVHVCLPFNFAIQMNLTFYGIIDIYVHEHNVVERMLGFNVELGIQVSVQCSIY